MLRLNASDVGGGRGCVELENEQGLFQDNLHWDLPIAYPTQAQEERKANVLLPLGLRRIERGRIGSREWAVSFSLLWRYEHTNEARNGYRQRILMIWTGEDGMRETALHLK